MVAPIVDTTLEMLAARPISADYRMRYFVGPKPA
jgi:hypothetical protein